MFVPVSPSGHRVDVQAVQLVLVGAQRVTEPGDRLPQIESGQPLEGRHRRAWYRPSLGRAVAHCYPFPVPPLVLERGHLSWHPSAKSAARARSSVRSLSHSHRRTNRRWNPNVQKVRAIVNGSPKRLHVCTACLKAGKVQKP